MSVVASYDAGTTLQSLSTSPDQQLCCVGGRDVLQIIRLNHETYGANMLDASVGRTLNGLEKQPHTQPRVRMQPRPSSLQPGATVRSERVFSRSLAAPMSSFAQQMDGMKTNPVLLHQTPAFFSSGRPNLTPFEPRSGPILSTSGISKNTSQRMDPVPAVAEWRVAFKRERSLKTGNMNLNHNGNDVAWHPDPSCANLIATGSTKGAVVCWNIERSGRSAVQLLSTEHNRTVTRICWHPKDPNILASASIDGTMRIWDTRTGAMNGKKGKWKSTIVMRPRASGARSMLFSPHEGHTVAGAFDNGSVQVWDTRKTRSARNHFAAHHGYVITLDWHPKRLGVLATGGRDGQIKVWDTRGKDGFDKGKVGIFGDHQTEVDSRLHSKSRIKSADLNDNRKSNRRKGKADDVRQLAVIQSMTSVACVRWRSSTHEYQLASSSTVVDPTLNVWDIQNPYIPIAVLKGHKSAVTDLQWIARENNRVVSPEVRETGSEALVQTAILSCSTDNSLCFHSLVRAERPVREAATCAIAASPRGGFAAYTDPIPFSRQHDHELNPLGPPETKVAMQQSGSFSMQVRSMPALMFVRAGMSEIHLCTPHHNHTFGIDFSSFSSYAKRYRCVVGGSKRLPAAGKPMTVAEVCAYNGSVARDLGCRLRTQAWETLASLMRSLEMSTDNSLQRQRERKSQEEQLDNAGSKQLRKFHVSKNNLEGLEDSKNDSSYLLTDAGKRASELTMADGRRSYNNSQSLLFGRGDSMSLQSEDDASAESGLRPQDDNVNGNVFDEVFYSPNDFDTLEDTSEGILGGMGGGILDQLDIANPGGAAFLDYEEDERHNSNNMNRNQEKGRRTASNATFKQIDPERSAKNRDQHPSPHDRQQKVESLFASVTAQELEIFGSANLQGRRIKAARVEKKRREREQVRQAARAERLEARTKEKAERKELRRVRNARTAEAAMKKVEEKVSDEVDAEAVHDTNDDESSAEANEKSGVTLAAKKAKMLADEAAEAEAEADAEFDRAADEAERAYEEDELRKEAAADAKEDIAYENDLSLSPLFKKLHLEVVRELVEHYCEQGDVQMCSTIALVLGSLVDELFGELRIQQWHSAYVEQLMQLRLPVVAATVMVRAGGKIARLNQRSTTIYTTCRQCGNKSIVPAESISRCNKCKRYSCCIICEQPVIGPFVWRSACGHGGHLACMEEWKQAVGASSLHMVCPAGCPEPSSIHV